MDSASTSSELISETGSIADSNLRDVDLVLTAVTAPAQVIEASVPPGLVETPPAIDAGQASTMDNVTPAPLCPTLITCAHAPPLSSTSNQLLFSSTGTAAPLLVMGPSSPTSMQGPISMLLGAPIAFSGVPRAPGGPPAPYSAIQSVGEPPAPYGAMRSAAERHITAYAPYASAFLAPPTWPKYVPSYMPRPPTQLPFMQPQFEELLKT